MTPPPPPEKNKKITTKSSDQKIFIFLKTQKDVEILHPQKWSEPTNVWKYQSPPPSPPPTHLRDATMTFG